MPYQRSPRRGPRASGRDRTRPTRNWSRRGGGISWAAVSPPRIIGAFDGHSKRLFVGHVVRFFPEYVRIKEMIVAGELGTVGVARTSRRSPFLTGWNDWYADWRMSGGGVPPPVLHDFDFLRWS